MSNENLMGICTYESEPIKETYTEGEFILADYLPPIMRIVRSEARALIRSKSVHGDKLTVEGLAEFTVIYLSDNGELNSCIHGLPFSNIIDISTAMGSEYEIEASVSYLNTRALSPQKLYLKATIEIRTSYTKKTEFSAVTPYQNDSIYTRNEDLNSFEIICSGHKPLKITDEIKPKTQIKSILRYDVFFNETEQKILTGKLISKADMLLKIVYTSAKDEPEVYEQKISVSQILDMEGITEETLCNVKYALTEFKSNINTSSADKENSLIYEITVNVDAVGYGKTKHLLCSDAFSEKNELKCTSHIFKECTFCKISKEQSFRESMDIGLYDKLYDISVNPTVLSTDYDKEKGSILVSGTFSCRTLYTDENNELSSTEKEIPFMLPVNTDQISENIKVSAEMYIKSFAYVENDSSSVELRIDCCYKGLLFSDTEKGILTEIETDNIAFTKESDRMILYFAEKDEKIWDISKKYKISPELLMKNNGLTDDSLKESLMLKI